MASKDQKWAEALRRARHAGTEEGDAEFEALAGQISASDARDPFVVRALISTFHDEFCGDGIDEVAVNILMDGDPRLWIEATLQDLPRLHREGREMGGCLLEWATRTPEVLLEVFGAESDAIRALLIEWMDELAREDAVRGIRSEIAPMLARLRAFERDRTRF